MALTSLFADDFVSVQHGAISRPGRDASRERFERYFAQVNFIAWDADGSLATVLVHKLAHLTFMGADGTPEEERTILPGRRHGGGRAPMELAMVISTRQSVRHG